MWNNATRNERELRRSSWTAILFYVAFVHAASIGTLQVLSCVLTGGFSPLAAGFGWVAAILFSLKKVGEYLFGPEPLHPST